MKTSTHTYKDMVMDITCETKQEPYEFTQYDVMVDYHGIRPNHVFTWEVTFEPDDDDGPEEYLLNLFHSQIIRDLFYDACEKYGYRVD